MNVGQMKYHWRHYANLGPVPPVQASMGFINRENTVQKHIKATYYNIVCKRNNHPLFILCEIWYTFFLFFLFIIIIKDSHGY